ncbi:hypothetical protein [Streptomyces sp. NPDC047974]|uniref:hypothetical protein n=1 Tax=Streptomyces sp. NPDC047974 TaxID=3154343 RepID=UPI0033CE5941
MTTPTSKEGNARGSAGQVAERWRDVTVNQVVDRRFSSIPFIQQDGFAEQSLYRGYITNARSSQGKPYDDKGPYSLLFHYNPSVINVSHSLDMANAPMPSYTRSDLDTGTPLVAGGGQLTFSLLFDRSYETSDATQQGTFVGDLGVLHDIHVLYNMVGMNLPVGPWGAESSDGTFLGDIVAKIRETLSTSTAASDSRAAIGVMQMHPVWIHFMNPRSTTFRSLPNMSRMSYFGYISSINITYTHFTQRMVPVRAAVGLSVQLMTSAGWQ